VNQERGGATHDKWQIALLASLLASGMRLYADDSIQLKVDTSEADSVLSILARRSAGEAVVESDWERLYASEPYDRLKRREAELKRNFDDAEFQRFVLSDALLHRAGQLQDTLAAWRRTDLDAAARRVLTYLPEHARIRAKVFPVIKPQTNSFVFELRTDPTVFLFVDPALDAEQFENTVAHELHHIGLASVTGEIEAALEDLPMRARTAAEWMGAFGEGIAMLAAAGSPNVHPHAHSSVQDRTKWDHDVANSSRDLQLVEGFFLDVIDGRLVGEDEIRDKGFAFFGVQGPWYTVGWKMAVLVEQRYGRATLIACMLDPRRLLATYNRAAAAHKGKEKLPLWSRRLLRAVHALPAKEATP
jgi:Putative zinc dependent peptidase (DUF5700)